ncbi:ATP-binding protein [Pseudobacteroides cellulosolvens]|uniref:ATP-binding protein n=1 Tax=Pseudobacteroides cellulosolvens TaxID=35825 RepID=UPI002ADE8BBE|nr:ATP-binding protein [Pseudobacteroides cellulosolvens]
MTTNLEFSKWNGIFYDEKLTSAIIDRLVLEKLGPGILNFISLLYPEGSRSVFRQTNLFYYYIFTSRLKIGLPSCLVGDNLIGGNFIRDNYTCMISTPIKSFALD